MNVGNVACNRCRLFGVVHSLFGFMFFCAFADISEKKIDAIFVHNLGLQVASVSNFTVMRANKIC